MSVESIKRAMMMSKLATGDTEEIPLPPQAGKDRQLNNTKVLEGLFESRDGLAQNSKKDLKRYFDTSNPSYNLRQQSLIEKVASVIKKA
jgi:hypothetical protein